MISKPTTVAAVDGESKRLSLAPIALDFIKRFTVLSPEGLVTMDESFHNEKKARSFHADLRRAMVAALSPGVSLEQTSAAMLSSVQNFLEDTLEGSLDIEEVFFSRGRKGSLRRLVRVRYTVRSATHFELPLLRVVSGNFLSPHKPPFGILE